MGCSACGKKYVKPQIHTDNLAIPKTPSNITIKVPLVPQAAPASNRGVIKAPIVEDQDRGHSKRE